MSIEATKTFLQPNVEVSGTQNFIFENILFSVDVKLLPPPVVSEGFLEQVKVRG